MRGISFLLSFATNNYTMQLKKSIIFILLLVIVNQIEICAESGLNSIQTQYGLSSSEVGSVISFPNTSYSVILGDEFDSPSLSNPNGLKITYSSADNFVATVDNNGIVTPRNIGQTVIYAKCLIDGSPDTCVASYKLNVERRKSEDEVFYEGFDENFGKGGNDGNFAGEGGEVKYGPNIKDNYVFSAYKCIFVGERKQMGSITIYNLDTLKSGNGCLTFKFMNKFNDTTLGYPSVETSSKSLSDNGSWKKIVSLPISYHKWLTVRIPFRNITSKSKITIAGQIYIDSVAIESYPPQINLTVGSTGYASMYYENYYLKVPENIDLYTMKVNGESIIGNHKYSAGDIIPKATGVIAKARQGNYVFEFSNDLNNQGVFDEENQLKGSDFKQLTKGGDFYYMLAFDDDGKVGFYWAEDNGGAFLSGAHKAYLALPSSIGSNSAKKGYVLNFGDDATSIKRLTVEGKDTDIFYNALGQRVGKDYKGIVIKNGRKFINR